MPKSAQIWLKIKQNLTLIMFFGNQLDNSDLHGQSDPPRARKWRSGRWWIQDAWIQVFL